MIRLFFICFLIFPIKAAIADPLSFLEPRPSSVVTIQTFRIQPYDKAVSGFEASFTGKVQTCVCGDSSALVRSQIEGRPHDLIVSVGLKSLTNVLFVKDTPILYLMVLDPPEAVYAKNNVFGISMTAHPADVLDIVKKTMPWVRKIGVLHGAKTADTYVELARQVAEKNHLVLMDQKNADPKQFGKNLKKLSHDMDIFWMIPDVSLLTSENIELLLLMSVENKIPILTFSEKFVELGAFMAISVDPEEMGKKAGRLARKIIDEPDKNLERIVYTEKTKVSVNKTILKKLNIQFEKEALEDLNWIK